MSAELVRQYLMEHGVRYQTHSHATAYTTGETAEAEHVPEAQMAKVVMLMADDHLFMVVLPGHLRVDLGKARTELGSENVRLANEAEFSPHFPDCATGAEPPFGALYDVAMVVDVSMRGPQVTFNSGSHTETITMDIDDYLELTNPKRVDLATNS